MVSHRRYEYQLPCLKKLEMVEGEIWCEVHGCVHELSEDTLSIWSVT